MEKAKAVKPTAHEIARLVYAMSRNGTEFVERTMEVHEHAHRERKLDNLAHQAGKLGSRCWIPRPTNCSPHGVCSTKVRECLAAQVSITYRAAPVLIRANTSVRVAAVVAFSKTIPRKVRALNFR